MDTDGHGFCHADGVFFEHEYNEYNEYNEFAMRRSILNTNS